MYPIIRKRSLSAKSDGLLEVPIGNDDGPNILNWNT